MADIYSTLSLSPKKRRVSPDSDGETYSPKKLRTALTTPPATPSKKDTTSNVLPSHLTRLQSIQNALQQALSHALATCAASPSETGMVRNVLNHISLNSSSALSTSFTVEDLRRLCWIWEWDGKTAPKIDSGDEEENPFLNATSPSKAKDWDRGGMGFVITSTTHFSKAEGKRVPAYGLGIEVEVDLDKYQESGMTAVARWTAASEARRTQFRTKLLSWIKMHSDPIPRIPLADLPKLSLTTKITTIRGLGSSPSKSSTSIFPPTPSSPEKSPKKRVLGDTFVTPDPISRPSSPTKKNSVPFPSTPSSRSERLAQLMTPRTPRGSTSSTTTPSHSERLAQLLTPRTPRVSTSSDVSFKDTTETPRGRDPSSVAQTPTTARRDALYERIRQRSLSASPSKGKARRLKLGSEESLSMTKDQMLKLEQEKTRKKFLLGRLGAVAESVWMLFSAPSTGTSTLPTIRKRRALTRTEVTQAIIKSASVPISAAEASESLDMLTNLCPFFLKTFEISGKDWLEMPASSDEGERPGSKGLKGKGIKSPKKSANKGLKEVKEIVQRELELLQDQDDEQD
ncbi:hypothetical protein K435DRAFT_833697 [Dendrothele bispora CBS 962.96]|uniref:DNA replication factor Cdt1 C-terminal domain-containing protein n=1 Tax=Dendrothele bispora (strain CBS 962.96) TaxID=1314807 RepID=A0A4S8MW78_DENBC|nr:hypothetical protein K435DRAFT_833697 [Dendrothele bispora CBS 962.96]